MSNVLPINANTSAIRDTEARDATEERRLSTSRGSEDRKEFPVADGQADLFQRRNTSKLLGECLNNN